MPPRTVGTTLRTELLEAAARLIASEGAAALTLRRVAEEVGTSTMAVYTHFGGMGELRRAVRLEGFARLAADLEAVAPGDDPLDGLVAICVAYYRNGTANPDLYRVMFMEQPLDHHDVEACAGTFETLVAGVQRCIAAGRLEPADATGLATELWAMGHGIVTLELSGLLPPQHAAGCVASALTHLLRSYGADPAAVADAVARARGRNGQAA